MKKLIIVGIIIYSFLAVAAHASVTEVRIGILSIRGAENTLRFWLPVSTYLGAVLPEYNFEIVPLEYRELEQAVASHTIDFAMLNPAEFVNFQVKYGVSRIATYQQYIGTEERHQFGSVVFAKAERTDLNDLSDLKGKSLVTSSENAFASWQVTRDEMKRQGVAVGDLGSVKFLGVPFDKVVTAVKNGTADAGAIRTDILEQMESEGKISLKDFRVISQKYVDGFPYLLSSELYPEFPLVRLKHTSRELADRVTSSLLVMNFDPVGRPHLAIGWTVPENYEKVHQLLQRWNLPPYEDYGKVTWTEMFKQHWDGVTLVVAFVLLVVLKQRLDIRKAKYANLEKEKQSLQNDHKEVMVQRDVLTRQKAELEAALAKVKLLEGIIPICSYCKKIRDDKDSWQQLEQYISNHSEALFSHGICPHCFEEQLKLIEQELDSNETK